MRLTRLSTRGKPLRVPVRSTSIDFRLLLRDPPSRGASAPIELCFVSARAFRRRATKAKDTSGRRSAILHFKNEHPLFRAVTESLTGVAPGAPAWTGWFTPPGCPLRSALPALRRAFSSRRKWSPVTSDAPSPPGRCLLFASSSRAIEAASPTPIVKCASVAQPKTSSSGKELFSNPLLVPHSVSVPLGSSSRRPFAPRR